MAALIEPETYRGVLRGTGGLPLDTTSSDAAVSGALQEAQELAESYLNRSLSEGARTETLYLYSDGTVFPSAPPIASVSDPAGAEVRGNGVFVGGWGLSPSSGVTWASPPQAEVTYVGGYTSATLPAGLRKALCWAAYDLLHESSGLAGLSNLPAGVTSVSVGDVAISAGGSSGRGAGTLTASSGALSERARKMLRPWRRQSVVGW
jgi:hypothetical protein